MSAQVGDALFGQPRHEAPERAQALHWRDAFEGLERHGYAVLGALLDPDQACAEAVHLRQGEAVEFATCA